ncbi:MAG: nuclear transport factor 2 family protein [Chloroflexi bacterium]|nr:nuclear transport factor 2 family protein [Chloroflexota bacterium]
MKADSKTEAEVMAVLNKMSEAYASRDGEGVLSVFAPDSDVVMYGTGADEKRIGREEIRGQVQRDWAQSEAATLEWGWHSVSAAGPVAWAAADATFNVKAGGQAMTLPGRMTAVLEKRGDRWLILQGHVSLPAAEQAEGESFPA